MFIVWSQILNMFSKKELEANFVNPLDTSAVHEFGSAGFEFIVNHNGSYNICETVIVHVIEKTFLPSQCSA